MRAAPSSRVPFFLPVCSPPYHVPFFLPMCSSPYHVPSFLPCALLPAVCSPSLCYPFCLELAFCLCACLPAKYCSLPCAFQVSFLAEQDAVFASGQFNPDECVEGSGKGDKPLYLYLVEDELDRLSLIMVG